MSQYSGSACKRKTFTFGRVECEKFRGDMGRDEVEVSLQTVKSDGDESGLKTNMSSAYILRLEFGDRVRSDAPLM